jgi:molybdenum-dependent DNA-binding transcriptional regulator ModE
MTTFISPDPAVRRDGWSPERKTRFLDRLASCGSVRTACAAVGMSREAAYTLRRRDALFARGWAAALVLAREASLEVLADKATEGIEEELWYRGELVGTRRRFDARLLLAHLARLDHQVEQSDRQAADDAARFDELLASLVGAEPPEEIRIDDEPLPLDRASALEMAEDMAHDAVEEDWAERGVANEHGELSAEDYAAYRLDLVNEAERARTLAEVEWDGWFARACRVVDEALEREEARPEPAEADSSPRTVSEVSSSPGAATFEGPDGVRYARA